MAATCSLTVTRNWSETIYYPDTVYTLNVGTSVPNYPNDNGMQVMPNPFDGTTRVNIQSQRTENVKMKLTDMLGHVCAEHNGLLQEGGNLFSVSLTTPQTYVLSVQTSSGIRSLKMENVGHAGTNSIAYEGATVDNMPVVQLKSSSSHPFELGDELSLTVYAYLNDTLMAHQTVTQIQNADDNVTVTFPVTQNSLNITSCPVVSVRTNETGFGNRISYVQDYDGNEYKVVQVGNQCWMREDLRVSHFPNGGNISIGDSYSLSSPYRYYPNNDSSIVSVCGCFYNWAAVMNGTETSVSNPSGVQGICPFGWHVPSEAEWTQLNDYVKSENSYVCESNPINIAKALAADTGWNASDVVCAPGNAQNANNATGFTAVPTGAFSLDEYLGIFEFANFWSSSEYSAYSATCVLLSHNNAHVAIGSRYKYDGISVRCVRDPQGSSDTGGGATSGTLPSVFSTSISNTTPTTAYATSIVTYEGSSDVTARGFCWSKSSYPTINDSHLVAGAGFGHFSATLTGLDPNTTYYVRAWATNGEGTAYGNRRIFKTSSADGLPCPSAATVADIDGNVYNTVQIGNQCWMKENLRTTHYADGSSIPLGTWGYDAWSATFPFYYICDDYCGFTSINYGYFYNWPAVMHGENSSNTNPGNVQGVCPSGWHVPSLSEWQQLKNYVSSQPQYCCNGIPGQIGKALASTVGWVFEDYGGSNWYLEHCDIVCATGNNIYGNNATGFSALPAGACDGGEDSAFLPDGCGTVAQFWSATHGWSFGMESCDTFPDTYYFDASENAVSVRCVKN